MSYWSFILSLGGGDSGEGTMVHDVCVCVYYINCDRLSVISSICDVCDRIVICWFVFYGLLDL